MPPLARSRRSVLVTAALVTALTVAGCSTGATQDGPGESAVDSSGATAGTAGNGDTGTATIDGEPVDVVAPALSERLSEVLASASDEFGDVDVDLLQLDPDSASLYFVDPAEPDTRSRSEYLDATWSGPVGTRRPGAQPLLPLDAIDPDIVRGVVEAAPELLEISTTRLSHVSISPDESGRAEYLVVLATGDSLGTATFDASGGIREVKPPL